MQISMNEVARIFSEREEFLIYTHMNPDGDAVASSIGLAKFLQSMGKKAAVRCRDEFPEKFGFLINDFKNDRVTDPITVGVDIPYAQRLGLEDISDNDIMVCIDHHASNPCQIEKTYLESDAVSCSLILYKIFRCMNVPIPKEVLSLLFAGIVTDSVCFQSAAVNSEAFAITAEMAKEIDVHSVIQKIFVQKTKNEIKVEQQLLSSFTYYHKDEIVVGVLKNDTISLIGKKNVSGYASMIMKPAGTCIGIAILEKTPGKYNLSFKSSAYDMVSLARKFGGGGHTESAGAIVETEELEGLIQKAVAYACELLGSEAVL